ncbi:GNAT family N-acetyltransferase [Dongshaea marina]|uniref:GNAT family N-acetyltransferase n=1 Tax=Dongshaea marina TaxID=2047966 RepID=UPI000D3E6D3B|nr:GNAT family N-acetyltransferase [Dongshaea marina]
MDIKVTTEPTLADIQDINNGLREHNAPYLGDVFRTEIACFAYKANGEKSGGIYGEILGHWLFIKKLWVDKSDKTRGLGTKLLNQAESYAIEKGCHSCLLDTFSFQARPFYEKNGYTVQMTLENHPISGERYYLTKPLQAKEIQP